MIRAIRHGSHAGRSLIRMLLVLAAASAAAAEDTGLETGTETTEFAPAFAAFEESPPLPASLAEPLAAMPPGEISLSSIILKLGLGLGLVILLVWGSVALLRKSAVGRQFAGGTGHIRVLERSYLGPKKSICLVRIGQRTLALGVTEDSITALAQLEDEEVPLTADQAGEGSSFVAQFKSILSTREQSRRLGEEVAAS